MSDLFVQFEIQPASILLLKKKKLILNNGAFLNRTAQSMVLGSKVPGKQKDGMDLCSSSDMGNSGLADTDDNLNVCPAWNRG